MNSQRGYRIVKRKDFSLIKKDILGWPKREERKKKETKKKEDVPPSPKHWASCGSEENVHQWIEFTNEASGLYVSIGQGPRLNDAYITSDFQEVG